MDYVFSALDISWWYYGIAILIGTVVWRCWRWEGGLLAGYTFLLLCETLLIWKPYAVMRFQPELLWSWRAWSAQKDQIITNVIMFIPFGLLAGRLWRWRGMLSAIGLSAGIEILQLVTRRGLCELDDVMHNSAGALIGVAIAVIAHKIWIRVHRDVSTDKKDM